MVKSYATTTKISIGGDTSLDVLHNNHEGLEDRRLAGRLDAFDVRSASQERRLACVFELPNDLVSLTC